MTGSEIPAAVRHAVARRMRAGEALTDELLALVGRADLDTTREVARLLLEEVGYLGEHLPDEREAVAPFACSGNTYHYCSFMAVHDPGCPAVGGSGELQNGYESARPCAPDCGETDPEQWCHVSGFECGTCEIVDNLLGILARAGASG